MTSGAGEEVEYTHTDSGVVESVRCYPQIETNEETNQTQIKNSIIFHGLELSESPKKNDIIAYDSLEWQVELIRKPVTDLYDITAYEIKHNLGRR